LYLAEAQGADSELACKRLPGLEAREILEFVHSMKNGKQLQGRWEGGRFLKKKKFNGGRKGGKKGK